MKINPTQRYLFIFLIIQLLALLTTIHIMTEGGLKAVLGSIACILYCGIIVVVSIYLYKSLQGKLPPCQ